MVVNYLRKPDGVPFAQLGYGVCFQIPGFSTLWLKIMTTYIKNSNEEFNAVNLYSGSLGHVSHEAIVSLCPDAQVVNKQ